MAFNPGKVVQLTNRRFKLPLLAFLVVLPRNNYDEKIFIVDRLCFMTVRIETYRANGVTQYYSCNLFRHNSENCRKTAPSLIRTLQETVM
ncbi:hypothetical protein NPIL_519051 [Nephila pilipes]|uniref:Uncharacterized protein n=1 Tax=Nephila pilipes TaxID=299642 RepID=A0A8X6U750_NEPPI|nr:hypothetical protein NPIL_519051 [Nephila pilipes]